ncbi:MAG: phosphatidylserine/phosphatidylglycerophosphate/cardiolipin synthase family protein [Rhizobiaceae bacterium]
MMRGWEKILGIGFFAAVLAGCSSLGGIDTVSCAGSSWDCVKSEPAFARLNHNNNPHVPDLPDHLAQQYDKRHLALVAADRARRIEKANGIGKNGASANSGLNYRDRKRYREIVGNGQVSGGRHALTAPAETTRQKRQYDRRWRVARQVMYLGGNPDANTSKRFAFSSLQASTAEVSFRSVADFPLRVSGVCDGDAELRSGRSSTTIEPGEAFSFSLAAKSRNRLAQRLSPGKKTETCTLDVSGRGYRDRVFLSRDDNHHGMDGRYDICKTPNVGNLPPLEQVFFADRWLSQTCVMGRQKPEFLADPRKAFNAKVEMLLGRPLSDAFYDSGDPKAPIDFSRAPDLDFIYVSYLDIKADFTGKVLERLLRHHAKKGTPIRMLVTEILERGKDRALLESIAADHPNVQIQEFRWLPSRGSAYNERASGLYKTHHIKLLATISRQRGATRMIIGGRNLHDGFLYKQPLDLSRYPDLQTYKGTNGLSLNYYSNYADFDIAISDPQTVRTVASHFSTVWNRDFETNVSRPFSIQTNGGRKRYGARHFISIPYADGKALENYYVELIDAAQKSIEIVNPYLNPPPAIEAAFERAIARGVEIVIVARVNLRGDLGGQFLTKLNELFVEKFADRIEMYEYLEEDVVLHSKLLMIDEKMSVVSSANFNHRSFIHDSENGMTFYDPAEYRRYKQVFETYKAASRRLTSDVEVPAHYRLLLSSKIVLEAL